MTVIYQTDGRIRVDDPHDALLLSLAGVELFDYGNDTYRKWVFSGQSWSVMRMEGHLGGIEGDWLPYRPEFPESLYVRKAWAKMHVLVFYDSIRDTASWNDRRNIKSCSTYDGSFQFQMRHHNNRWHVLPDIKMENDICSGKTLI